MLNSLESLLRTLVASLVLLLGWAPSERVLVDDGPVARALSGTVGETVGRLGLAVGGGAEEGSASPLDGPRADAVDIETLDGGSADDRSGEGSVADRVDSAAIVPDGSASTDDEELDDSLPAPDSVPLVGRDAPQSAADIESLDGADRVFDDFENLDDLILPEVFDDFEDLDDAIVDSGAATVDAGDTAEASGTEGGGGGGGGGGGRTASGTMAGADGNDRDCADFRSQAAAQQFFVDNGGSAGTDVDGLDANGDGQACENFDYGSATGDGGRRAGTAGTENGGGEGGGNRETAGGGGGGGRTAAHDGAGVDGGNDAVDRDADATSAEGGGGDAASSAIDVSSCRTVAESNGNVAATGCVAGERANVVASSAGDDATGSADAHGSGGADPNVVVERGDDVRVNTTIERSADGGTEIAIDRGGDANGGRERAQDARSAADRSSVAQELPTETTDGPTTPSARGAGDRYDDPVLRWLPEMRAAAKRTKVPVEQIAALMRITSGGEADAVFSDGGLGLLKVPANEFEARGIGKERRTDPETNVRVGSEVFAQRLAAAGSLEAALSGYVGDAACAGGTGCGVDSAGAGVDWIAHYRDIVDDPAKVGLKPLEGLPPRVKARPKAESEAASRRAASAAPSAETTPEPRSTPEAKPDAAPAATRTDPIVRTRITTSAGSGKTEPRENAGDEGGPETARKEADRRGKASSGGSEPRETTTANTERRAEGQRDEERNGASRRDGSR